MRAAEARLQLRSQVGSFTCAAHVALEQVGGAAGRAVADRR